MITVKVLKDWKGEVCVDGSAPLQALLDAVGAMPAGVPAADVESLIVKGRKLVVSEHASSSLATLGIADRTAVMLIRRRTSVGEMRREEDRLGRLEEVRAALGVVWAASATGWVGPRRWHGVNTMRMKCLARRARGSARWRRARASARWSSSRRSAWVGLRNERISSAPK